MAVAPLSALDTSFLQVETGTAHMHVGWAARFDPPESGRRPSFELIRAHVASRLGRAPRYRQRLRSVPFGLGAAVWTDDEAFHPSRHIHRSQSGDLLALAGDVLSRPLARDRPLWELHVAEHLDDGGLGIVGKVHHCMVDGVAAVELAAVLLDPSPDAEPRGEEEPWAPAPAPAPAPLFASRLRGRIAEQMGLLALPMRAAAQPRRAAGMAARIAVAAADALRPAPPTALNGPITPQRTLHAAAIDLEELQFARRALRVTLNDIVLAAAAGALRRFARERGEDPVTMKAMVPVSVRERGHAADLGNRIAFIFVDLPCEEPDRRRRLEMVHAATKLRKRAGEPEGADVLLGALSYLPGPLQRLAARQVSSPRTFNLVVSNIPGPPIPLWMLGCRLREAYPVIPLAEQHAVSLGFTSIDGEGCFGVYADADAVPDGERLAVLLRKEARALAELAMPAHLASREREPAAGVASDRHAASRPAG